ncbi:MAG: hypothetical protein WCF65_08965 [Parachlamydiaceae bacterium]
MDATNQHIAKFTQGIKLVAFVNGIAAIFHVIFWTFVFLRLPRLSTTISDIDRADLTVTYGLGIADLLWSVPFLIIGSIWLQKHRLIGWLAAQMANALWWYSFTFIIFREYHTNIRPGTILFLPFALFSIWSSWYLWQVKTVFLENTSEKLS